MAIAGAGLITVGLLWQAQNRHERDSIRRATQAAAADVEETAREEIGHRSLAVKRMAGRWQALDRLDQAAWEGDAQAYVDDFRAISAVAVIEPDITARWVVPWPQRDLWRNTSFGLDPAVRVAFEAARSSRQVALSPAFDLPWGGHGAWLTAPAYREDRFQGYVGALLHLDQLLDLASRRVRAAGFSVQLFQDGEELAPGNSGPSRWAEELPLDLAGPNWRLRVAPTEAALQRTHSVATRLTLGVGVFLSLALAAAAYLARQNRLRAREAEAARTQARASDQQNRAILEAIPDLMLRMAGDGTVRALKSAKGFLDRSDLVGHKLHEVFPTDFTRLALPALERALATGETQTAEYHLEIEGQTRHREARLALCGAGEALIIVRDVTELKRAEARARDARTILQAILDNSPSLIFVKDLAGRYLMANRALEPLVGMGRDEIVGKTDYDLFPKEVADGLRLNDRRVLDAGRALEWEETPVARGGHYVALKFPLRDATGQVYAVGGIATDITERKAAEQALRESEERYRSLFEGNLAGVYRSTAEGRILDCNQAFAQIYGYPSPEAVKAKSAPALYLAPGDRDDFLARLRAEGEIHGLESRAARADGTPIWILENVRLLPGEGGGVLEGTMVDITERKRLEDQLAHAERMDALGRLAGGVAHDFNNLLTAILGFADLLQRRLGPGPDSKAARDLGEIRKAAQRASELTRKLLAFSRKQALSPQVLDLNHAIRDIEKMLRRLLGEQVEIATVLAPGRHAVRADPGQLEQVIVNLAVNARDALPQGGTIRIETAALVVDEAAARELAPLPPGTYEAMAISDDGVGMDETTLAHIFEPFFTTKPKGKGTGLGLATVYGIVSQSGGQVTVHSQPGQGTTFTVYLPQVTEAPVEPRAAEEGAPLPLGTERILVVEDEDSVRDLVTSCLESYGYSVLQADNAARALQLVESEGDPVHLLLTDVVMPKMGGPELARILSGVFPNLKVLFMSGYAPTSLLRDGTLDRGRPLLQKPFTPAELAGKVREVLEAPALEGDRRNRG